MRWGLGEQPLSWVSSGKLPLRQLELNPEEDSGSLWSSTCTSECHQVSGRRGGGHATSLAPAACYVHRRVDTRGQRRPLGCRCLLLEVELVTSHVNREGGG